MPKDGTFYDPNQKDYVGIPPMQVRYYPNEWEKSKPGGHTEYGPKLDSQVQDNRISELVRVMAATFDKIFRK